MTNTLDSATSNSQSITGHEINKAWEWSHVAQEVFQASWATHAHFLTKKDNKQLFQKQVSINVSQKNPKQTHKQPIVKKGTGQDATKMDNYLSLHNYTALLNTDQF